MEVAGRAFELARLHQAPLRWVCVRNQRSRWGSCSTHGTVSLNWRLIQMPPSVRDYLIIHELAHFKQMNHSAAYWRLVEDMDPHYLEAEKWLRHFGRSLR
jgi:predicted metal-dependent hydrolase